jgi:hypothetical protein
MPPCRLGKRQRFPDVTGIPLTQRVVPAFHMGGFSGLFADAAVRFDREHGDIRLPEIADTDAGPIGLRNPLPQPTTGAFAVIANDKRNNLSRATTQHRPQPAFPRPLADKRPDFIDFQVVIGVGWLQRRAQGRQGLEFFLSRRPGLFERRRRFG